jgi:hypothetical protein
VSDDPNAEPDHSSSHRIPGLVGDVVQDAINAISAEIVAASNDPTSTIELRNGRYVGTAGSLDLWVFEGDDTFPAMPETPASISIRGGEPMEARVVAVDDRDYVIGLIDELPDDVPLARLSLEPWFIYAALRDRLAAFDDTVPGLALAESLIDIANQPDDVASEPIPPIPGESLSAEQRSVAGRAMLPGLRFVWGPPGTGKTATLAATVRALVENGQRVMILAHANAAVDVAMVRVAEMCNDHPMLFAGRILRVGTPHLPDAREHEYINPDEIIRRRSPALVDQRDQLIGRRRKIAGLLRSADSQAGREALTDELDGVRAELSMVEKRLAEARNELIENAVVVGMTLSRAVINDLLWSWPADVVIVDESSMAGLPFLLALALRGATTLSLFGDFRQLPPIAVSRTTVAQQWFARDAFELAGVKARVEAGEKDNRLSILRTQYRMGSDIAAVVGRFAYFDLLRTDIGADERAAALVEREPGPGSQIVLVDTSAWETTCLVDADPNSYSRFNLLSAALSTSIAASLIAQGLTEVGVISAYRAQATIVTEVCRSLAGVTSATTHRFQGSERDAIVLDLVDALPQSGPSMLTGKDPDLSLRLLNVAASRPRGKLVLVADLSFIEHHHALGSPARTLVELADQRGAVRLDASAVVSDAEAVRWFDRWADGVSEVLDAGLDETSVVDVSVPSGEYGTDWLVELATTCGAIGARLVCRAPIDVAIHVDGLGAEIHLKPAAAMPIATISGSDRAARVLAGGRSASSPCVSFDVAGLERVVAKHLTG